MERLIMEKNDNYDIIHGRHPYDAIEDLFMIINISSLWTWNVFE